MRAARLGTGYREAPLWHDGVELPAAAMEAAPLPSSVDEPFDEWSIDCHYARTGGLLLAHHEAQVPHLVAEAREWQDDLGEDARFLARDELASEIGSTEYHGGLLVERTGGLQPAEYHAGLVRRAVEQGAGLHGWTRVTRVTALGGGDGYQVDTTRGSLRAGEVLVAANATVDAIVPELRRRVVPMGSFIIATEPLDPELAASCIPNGRMVYDTKNFLFYWRRSPDDRLVFGGRTSLVATTVPEARDVLARELVRVHPQLEGVGIDRAWGGNVAITFDRLPHCGRTPLPEGGSVAFAAGCNGTGVALMTWFGQQAARWLAGEGAPPAFARLPFPKVPLHSQRDRYLPAVGQWFRIRDRYGR